MSTSPEVAQSTLGQATAALRLAIGEDRVQQLLGCDGDILGALVFGHSAAARPGRPGDRPGALGRADRPGPGIVGHGTALAHPWRDRSRSRGTRGGAGPQRDRPYGDGARRCPRLGSGGVAPGAWADPQLHPAVHGSFLGARVALAEGSIITLGQRPRAAVGPDLLQMFLGSEGMFGVILEVTLRVYRQAPTTISEAFTVPTVDAGLAVLREAYQAGLRPSLMRLYDASEARHAVPGRQCQVVRAQEI